MPQVKIYGLKSAHSDQRAQISDAIHQSLMEVFGTPQNKRFQRYIWLEPDDFIYPDDRTDQYLIIEISMFEGRTLETKKKLIHQLYQNLSAQTTITPQDLEITLFETPPANWGLRGHPGDELKLSYKVNV